METLNAINARLEDDIEALRVYARQCYQRGKFREAADRQIEAINAAVQRGGGGTSGDFLQAAFYVYALRDHKAAAVFLAEGCRLDPDNLPAKSDLGFMLYRSGDESGALRCLNEVLVKDPTYLPAYDALAEIYGKRNEIEKMREYGELSLQLKDDEAHATDNLAVVNRHKHASPPQSGTPNFDPNCPEKNIIAFSLWGSQRRFTQGAIMNARLMPFIYPSWTARFYVDDSVPDHVVAELQRLKAQIQKMKTLDAAFAGLFWRFLASDDASADRFLIRDCDSVISCQERVAVDAWLASGKAFHLMRDNCTHTELILAGMWGGVCRKLPRLAPMIEEFCRGRSAERTIDQQFLRLRIWPLIKGDHLTHDSHFSFLGSRQFPKLGRHPAGMHVGRNENLDDQQPSPHAGFDSPAPSGSPVARRSDND